MAMGQPRPMINEGRQFQGSTYSGGMFGGKFSDIAGPPPVLDPHGYARSDVSLYTTPDAYAGKSLDFLATTLELLLTMLPTFPSELVPLMPTDQLTIKVTQHQINTGIAERVPDLGVPRVTTQGRTEYVYKMVPYGKAIHIYNGFWLTEEGRQHFARQQVLLRQCFQLAMDCERFNAIFNAPVYQLYKDALMSNNGIKYQNLNGVFEKAKRLFAILHTEGGLNYLDEQMSGIFENNVVPDTILLPPGAASLVTLADKHETEYYRKGPGSETVLREGKDYILNYHGKRVWEVPTYYVDERQAVENFATRCVQIGDAFQIRDFHAGMSQYTTRRTRTLVYSMDVDNGGFKPFDISHVVSHSGVFDTDGNYSDYVRGFVAKLNNGPSPNLQRQEHLVLPVIARGSDNKYRLIQTIGEMELPYLSVDAISKIVGGFVNYQGLSEDIDTRNAINAGVNLMRELSTPDLTQANVQAYFNAIAEVLKDVTTGIAPPNAFGTMKIETIPTTNAAVAGIVANTPYGFGTWPGIRTLAARNTSKTDKQAAEFEAAVRKLAGSLAKVFPNNLAFDNKFCPFFLRPAGDENERLCVFVHALLASNVTPSFVLSTGGGGYLNDAGGLFGAGRTNAGRQMAYILRGSGNQQVVDALLNRTALENSFGKKADAWTAELALPTNSSNAAIVDAFVRRYVSTSGGLMTDGAGNVGPTVQRFYNAIRFNEGSLSLPQGSALSSDIVNMWGTSTEGAYNVYNDVNVRANLSSPDLVATLDTIAANATGTWTNTRLFIDGSSYRAFANSANANLDDLAIRPASPVFPGIPLATVNNSTSLTLLKNVGSELEVGANPLSNIIATSDDRMDMYERMYNMTTADLMRQIDLLKGQMGAPRFGLSDPITERWGGLRRMIGDPIQRAVAIMYLTQPMNKMTMDSFVTNHMPLPFEGIGVRPRRKYIAGSVVMCKGGSDFAVLAYGHPLSLAQNSTVGVWTFQYKMYFAAVIKDTSRTLLAPDVCVTRYIRGEGTKIVEPRNRDRGDVFIFMVPYGSASGNNRTLDSLNVRFPVDVTGFYKQSYLQDKIDPNARQDIDWQLPTYPTYRFYNHLYNFDQVPISDPWSGESFGINRHTEVENTLCYQTGQYVPSGPGEEAPIDAYIRNGGHFGDYIPDNSKELRSLPARCMLPPLDSSVKVFRE